MKNTTRELVRDIKAERNLEQVLPELMNSMASLYGLFSYYNMNMELSVFKESKAEEGLKIGRSIKDLEERIYEIMKKTLVVPFSPDAYEEAIKELIDLREKVISKVDILTAYTDLFILYEYMLNRLEAEFEPEENLMPMDNDAVAKEILQKIFSDEEPALINQHIKEMLSCLPIRMTKSKFLELVENSFSIYEKSDAQSVEMYDYILRCAAGLYTPKGMTKSFGRLDKVKKLFESKNPSELTNEEYQERKTALADGIEYLKNDMECLESIQSIANALLSVLLTRQYFTMEAEKLSERPQEMTKKLLAEEAIDTEKLFKGAEADMETLMEECKRLESAMLDVKETKEKRVHELLLSVVYQRILIVMQLNSGSKYVSLKKKEIKEEKDYLKKVKELFLKDIKMTLDNGSRLRNRAMMAAVLGKLPVFFNNRTEVMQYVRNALGGCKNEQEKKIGVELLRKCYEM